MTTYFSFEVLVKTVDVQGKRKLGWKLRFHFIADIVVVVGEPIKLTVSMGSRTTCLQVVEEEKLKKHIETVAVTGK